MIQGTDRLYGGYFSGLVRVVSGVFDWPLSLSRGAKGGNFPVGRTRARNPTAKPGDPGSAQEGDLGPTTVGAVLMRTTCVRGAPRIFNTWVIRGVAHHTAVVRVPRERLCRSQEKAVQDRVAAP